MAVWLPRSSPAFEIAVLIAMAVSDKFCSEVARSCVAVSERLDES